MEKKGIRIILWILAFCVIICFLTLPMADFMAENVYDMLVKISQFIILLLATGGISIIYILKKTGLRINAKVEKYSFYSRGVNNYKISYNVDGNTYYVRASDNDYRRKEKVEILVLKRYPWIMIDKFQSSGIVIFTLICFIVSSLMFLLPVSGFIISFFEYFNLIPKL